MAKAAYRLSRKKMADRRFLRTELAIVRTAFKKGAPQEVCSLAKQLGIHRNTFYHHHMNTEQIIPDLKRYLMEEYRQHLETAILKRKNLKGLYRMTLFFMQKHRDILAVVIERDGVDFLNAIFRESEQIANAEVGLPIGSDVIRRVYYGEICGLLSAWCNDGMRTEPTNRLVVNLLFLAGTAKTRLGPLVE